MARPELVCDLKEMGAPDSTALHEAMNPACPIGRLFAPDLPGSTAQQGNDFLLNLRIVQQTQKRLFESLVLLCLLDLVFSFGSILHRTIMLQGSSAERPSAVMPQKPAEGWRRPRATTPILRLESSVVSTSKIRPNGHFLRLRSFR
jgi:hypothetical protein